MIQIKIMDEALIIRGSLMTRTEFDQFNFKPNSWAKKRILEKDRVNHLKKKYDFNIINMNEEKTSTVFNLNGVESSGCINYDKSMRDISFNVDKYPQCITDLKFLYPQKIQFKIYKN
jgi:hypothetical protein